VGVQSIFRYHWREDRQALVLDTEWRHDYITGTQQVFGWDVVIDGLHAWFMDNGKHNYRLRMIDSGLNPSPNRLIRVALNDSQDHQAWEISGLRHGSITNPPLVDVQRGIVVAYDAANRVMRAWDVQDPHAKTVLTPKWEWTHFGCASHMILYPDTGELVTNDYRHWGEEVVVLDITTGFEKARVRSGGITQGVVFPSAGWGRDFYWSSMGRLARIFVA
jgi:hypothetical protein